MFLIRYTSAAFAIFVLAAYSAWMGLVPMQESGSTMPPAAYFSVLLIDGTALDSVDLRGDIVILDFWASWCGPCLTEIPFYNELHRNLAARGLRVIGIAIDSGDAAAVARFSDQRGIDYPLVVGVDEVVESFGPIWGLPRTILIGPDWKVHKVWTGAGPGKQAQLRALVGELLAERDGTRRPITVASSAQ